MDQRLALNRSNWNQRTPIHAGSNSYDLAGFRSGRQSLRPIELESVGGIAGRSLLHLQCHFGQDTISWARLGARATGVDFSDRAIDLARRLNAEAGTDARFICANVYDLPAVLGEQFDWVVTTYGVLAWLPDLARWAQVVHRHLKPGGAFLIVDFHPLLGAFDPAPEGLQIANSYFHHQLSIPANQPTYAGGGRVESPCYEWQHSLGDVVNALCDAGLSIESLNEYPYCAYRAFPHMVRGADGWWRFPENNDSVPQMFSIRAGKPKTG